MLRELNLYPMWVRREQPETVQEAVSVAPPDQTVMTGQVESLCAVVPDEASDGETSAAHAVSDLFAAMPPDAGLAGDDSLREFHLKNAGGLLGRVAWPELKQKVHDCQLCKLRADCTQTVFGTGDEQADWLFVGEAPGHEEDEQGLPFVGEAGRLLDNMLMAIGLRRDENVYIANVIKCRPPDDRHPHVGEIAACLPYLRRQIGLVRPKIIVALGKTAATALLETDATVASLRGRVHDYNGHGSNTDSHLGHAIPHSNLTPQAGGNVSLREPNIQGIPLIVTYHPAYLLRSPMEKVRAWADLCLAVNTMRADKSI